MLADHASLVAFPGHVYNRECTACLTRTCHGEVTTATKYCCQLQESLALDTCSRDFTANGLSGSCCDTGLLLAVPTSTALGSFFGQPASLGLAPHWCGLRHCGVQAHSESSQLVLSSQAGEARARECAPDCL